MRIAKSVAHFLSRVPAALAEMTDLTTGRIVRSADFERVLRTPPHAKSVHFALHHVRGWPSRFVPRRPPIVQVHPASVPWAAELSTGAVINSLEPVDDSLAAVEVVQAKPARWLGTVVPKRHARRSVTRSLMKRQMHAAFGRQACLPEGLWVLRLRSGFDVKQFRSAASEALRLAVRQELDALLAGLVRRLETTGRAA